MEESDPSNTIINVDHIKHIKASRDAYDARPNKPPAGDRVR